MILSVEDYPRLELLLARGFRRSRLLYEIKLREADMCAYNVAYFPHLEDKEAAEYSENINYYLNKFDLQLNYPRWYYSKDPSVFFFPRAASDLDSQNYTFYENENEWVFDGMFI